MPPATTTPPLRERLRPLVLLGLAIGLLRYAMEFVAPQHAMWFGVYYVMAAAILFVGITGKWGPIRWPVLLGTMALLCLIVWGIPNTVAYTTGQFLEWNHGRFHHGVDDPETRAAPIAATALGKIGWGLVQGLATSVAGTIWCTVLGTVFIWLPGRLRARSRAVA